VRPLLHLCTPADWRAALDTGALHPAGPFVHLSYPEQVHLPAQRLFPGRRDLLLLVVDPARLPDPVREEPGDPADPAGMRFPHLYGPLPARAVVAVVPYRPPVPPLLPAPDDALGRAWALTASFAVRRAARVRDVPGGVEVTDPRFRHSHEHNRLVLDGPTDADAVAAAAAGLPTPTAVLLRPDAAPVAADLAARGWTAVELLVMARSPAPALPGADRAEVVPVAGAAAFREAGWRQDLPADLPDRDEVVAQLVGREALLEPVAAVSEVVVREGGRVVAAGQLRVDGATAGLESVATEPAARGRGHGDAVLARALEEAAAAGCDLVVLEAAADDWPRHWYARRGFAVVGSTWEVTAPQAGGATQDSSR
jgi:uncharacterized protein (DUF952 family)/ribosomal protein S18 acetylase RimI-like enzyme